MATRERGTVVQRLGSAIADVVERWMPSPFLFAILLSYVVFVAGILVEGAGPAAMVGYWYDGFWTLLTFGMQMVLILATGYVVAYHPLVRRGIERLTRIPNDGRQAVVLVGVIAMVVAWVQWGLGLIVGAVLAREMGRQAHERGLSVHYPLLCVAGYMGMGLTWHWGLAGSAPLLMNTPGNVFVEQGIVDGLISTSQTVFSGYSLALTVLGIVYAALALYLLAPTRENSTGITEYVPLSQLRGTESADVDTTAADGGTTTSAAGDGSAEPTPSDRINNSQVVGGVIALTGVGVAVWTFATEGLAALNLNVMNFMFLFIGLALFTSPEAYENEFGEAVLATSGIILQFPFYAGIIGMMNSSGLSTTLAETLVSVSTPATFPAVAWITAGIINFFVPSGGGEWTVIGETILQAADQLGVPPGQAVVAYAVGDAHTNLFQPFWALPLLGITGMRARDVFGYAATVMLLLIPFLAAALILIPY
ncbi:short-chain fatty acid transporter [Halococcus sp. IIIV-5B]|uniref:short-chain fatty acid transporter n=1 Tax=Halococcus sp. IIIV-5B TaxID=2321230 RepID=UPI000E714629|nr:TIGR00366 family protein [Halococcus sp. IIIV-5B]RJT04401.1 short-chain fatty acid transporter [Halococcus sp. IIIV-5B]